jgi:hypothetical protein
LCAVTTDVIPNKRGGRVEAGSFARVDPEAVTVACEDAQNSNVSRNKQSKLSLVHFFLIQRNVKEAEESVYGNPTFDLLNRDRTQFESAVAGALI